MEQNIYYRIVKFDLSEFEMEGAENYDGSEIDINCRFKFEFSYANECVKCTNYLTFIKGSKDMVKASFEGYFTLSPETITALTKDDNVVLPVDLQAQFASITYSTLRGVLFCKTEGTMLQSVILPPNNILSQMEHDIYFQKPAE